VDILEALVTTLERRYRLLLHAYPRDYRTRRGEEILGTLMESAAPGQRRPGRADLTDAISGGLRERLGLNALPGFANGLRLSGPIALALTAGLAAGSWITGARHAAGTVVAAVWAGAVLARLALPRAGSAAAALAWLVTIVAAKVDGLDVLQRLPNQWFLAPIVLGAIAVAGTFHRPTAVERIGLGVGASGLLVLSLAGPSLPVPEPHELIPVFPATFHLPQWALHAWLAPVLLALAGVALATGRRDTRALWAALILLVPMPLIVRPPYLPWSPVVGDVPDPSLLPALTTAVIALMLVIAVGLAVRARQAQTPHDVAADLLARCGRLCLATAAGLAAFVLGTAVLNPNPNPRAGPAIIGLALVAAAPLASRWLPRWVTRLLLAAGLAAFAAGALGSPAFRTIGGEPAAVAVLAVLALIAWGRSPRGAAILAGVAFAVVAGIAYGLAFGSPEFIVMDLPFVPSDDCRDVFSDALFSCAGLAWAQAVIPSIVTGVLVPTMVCSIVAVLRDGGIRASGVFVVSFAWFLGAFGPTLLPLGYLVVGVLAFGVLQTARVVQRLRVPPSNGVGVA
jgi:hypothetical protein